ncbi:MAG: LysR family transcriptional regulator [Halioglobus sp.]
MVRQYPPLSSLLFFLTSARTLSFTVAAEELFVTRSAVSRQIKGLEDHLGIELFKRTKTGLELTDKGLDYSNALSPIFADLKTATNALLGEESSQKLTLGISTTFNATWLMSRLRRLYELHPAFVIAFLTNNVDTPGSPVDFSDGTMNAAIRLGYGDWPGCSSEKLLDIYVQPLCSPELCQEEDSSRQASNLTKHNWLHYKHLPDLWRNWYMDAGLVDFKTEGQDIILDNVTIAVQAAVDGLGIIPMYRPLADHLLASGELVVAHKHMYLKSDAYYFVTPDHNLEHGPTAIFRDWILPEAATYQAQWNSEHVNME